MNPYEATTAVRIGTPQNGWDLRVPHHRASQRWLQPGGNLHEHARFCSLAQNLDRSGVLYDIGAEQGDHTALLARWMQEGGGQTVVAEPAPEMWPAIRTTFEANGVEPPAASWVGFVGSHSLPGVEALSAAWPPECFGAEIAPSVEFPILDDETRGSVITVDLLASRTGLTPTALNIDVEGGELEVLRGARATLTQHRPQVWVSIHPAYLAERYGKKPADVIGYMESLDYRYTYLGSDHEVHALFSSTEADWS